MWLGQNCGSSEHAFQWIYFKTKNKHSVLCNFSSFPNYITVSFSLCSGSSASRSGSVVSYELSLLFAADMRNISALPVSTTGVVAFSLLAARWVLISRSISDICRFISFITVGLLLSVSEAWPDDSPSSSTGMLEYNLMQSGANWFGFSLLPPGGPSLSNSSSDTSLSRSPQFESQSVVSGERVKLREWPTCNPPTSVSPKSSVDPVVSADKSRKWPSVSVSCSCQTHTAHYFTILDLRLTAITFCTCNNATYATLHQIIHAPLLYSQN